MHLVAILISALVLQASGGRTLESSREETQAVAIEGSQIFRKAFEFEKTSATGFVLERLLELERVIRQENNSSGPLVAKQDEEIRRLVSQVLDLESIGNFALGRHYQPLQETELGKKRYAEYISVFRRLVEENYLESARRYLGGNHEISFRSETKTVVREESFEIVEASIRQPDVDLVLQFFVVQEEGKRKIVDIRLDATSLRETYRGSFNRIINPRVREAKNQEEGRMAGLSELIEAMSNRLAELQSGGATRL
ncbi:MAG: hypothetical protein EA369_06700 [Bradymonadales bacterium]|nr:MAG: hypothetical protein EA369_06700 [Bradymonadales bacterium]